MLIETHLDKEVSRVVRELNDAESLKHTPSGKLSAGSLMEPLQWQILKALGVGKPEFDDYTLRKFLRGKQVEEWLLSHTPSLLKSQEFVEYRGVVGYVDAIVETDKYDHNLGIIPHEIKSVTNAKFKRLMKTKEADSGHKLQGGLYALALGASHYAINYVATDDLRIATFIYPVADIKEEIDQIITDYDNQIEKQVIPIFEPRFSWQANKLYNKFPEWSELTEEECQLAINYHFPNAWEEYKEKKNAKKENK